MCVLCAVCFTIPQFVIRYLFITFLIEFDLLNSHFVFDEKTSGTENKKNEQIEQFEIEFSLRFFPLKKWYEFMFANKRCY